MCGIVGVLTPGQSFPGSILTTMRDRLAHRGPDDGDNWIFSSHRGTVALAHRRLSILDPRIIAKQPMTSSDGQVVITFNGEIYNYADLKQELITAGRSFKTNCDTEVLLQAYEVWGEVCLHKLNGMFAFIIWDNRKQKALIARDRFGEKPVFYAQSQSGGIAFASEMKALFPWHEIPCEVDLEKVNLAQTGTIYHGRPDTLFKGIRRFLPAHLMWVQIDGTIEKYERYWTPDYEDIDYGLGENQIIDGFRERLIKAVRLRSRADVKGAACLSGGLDSSSLVGILTQHRDALGFSLDTTLSVRFEDDQTIDEGSYIDRVLKYVKLSGETIKPSPQGLVETARHLHWHHEENILSTSIYLEWCLMKRARELNYLVMIDGQGADELLGGYQYYFQYFQHDSFVKEQWWKLQWNTQLYAFRLWLASLRYDNYERRFSRNPGKTYAELQDRGSLPYADPNKYPNAPGLPKLAPGNSFRYTLASGMLYDSLPSQLHSGDRNSMAHGVECRYPFLDYELVDWCIKLPNRAFINRGWQKAVLRQATYGFIPSRVRWRADKVGYSGPQDTWVREGLKAWIGDRIFDSTLRDLESYDLQKIQNWWSSHQNMEADYSTILWQWASIAEWLNMAKQGIWKWGL